MGRPARSMGKPPRAAAGLALAGMLACAGIAGAQSLYIPDLRRNLPRETAPGPMAGQPCERCGVVRSIREVHSPRPVAVPQSFQTQSSDPSGLSASPVGAVVALPMGEGSGEAFVGGVGTPEMRERLSETSYEITILLDSGGYTVVTRREGARFRVGDRVRVEGTQLTLLAQ